MFVRAGLAAGGVFGLHAIQPNKVQAAEPPSDQVKKKKIRPSELPIYGEPEVPEYECVPELDTVFHQQVSAARKWTWSYLDSIKGTTDRAKEIYTTGKAHSTELLTYIQEDSGMLPRAAIITVSGLGGIVAGYRGGVLRKTVLASIAMAGAASVCYPREAIDIGRTGWEMTSDVAIKKYHDLTKSTQQKEESDTRTKDSDKTSSGSVTTSASSSTAKMDFGMSKPEDKDMYTTRDS